jgi:hypothetical protein
LSIREALDRCAERNLLWRSLGGKDSWEEEEALRDTKRIMFKEFENQQIEESIKETSVEGNT